MESRRESSIAPTCGWWGRFDGSVACSLRVGVAEAVNEITTTETPLHPDWRALLVGSSSLVLLNRPKERALPVLAARGLTDVVTLLMAREGGTLVGSACRVAGLRWHHAPIERGRAPIGVDEAAAFEHAARSVLQILEQPNTVTLLHCSAGLHRTGMVALRSLKLLGVSDERALEILDELRPRSREEMTEARLAYGLRGELASAKPSGSGRRRKDRDGGRGRKAGRRG
ncbi:MAG: tyrosine-protein phosphatase [Myxococcales bacterium]|nr:tyrosine-protein phosphatase [Myxococcales bacterium]